VRDDVSWLEKGGIVTKATLNLLTSDVEGTIIPLEKMNELIDLEIDQEEMNEIINNKLIKKMEIKYDRRNKKRLNDKHVKRIRSS